MKDRFKITKDIGIYVCKNKTMLEDEIMPSLMLYGYDNKRSVKTSDY